MPSITSIMFQNHHTVIAYLYPYCSRSMKQGKAIRKPVRRGKAKMQNKAFHSLNILTTFGSARTLNQLIKSRATQCPARINGYGITDASHILGFFIDNVF